MPQLNMAGEALIKGIEELRLLPYLDEGGVWTNGWGNTENVTSETPAITPQQAEIDFKRNVSTACNTVLHYCYPAILNDNQFSALVSLCFNCGSEPMHDTIGNKIRASDMAGAAEEFARWHFVKGKSSNGLIIRRAAEKKLFNTPVA